MVMVVVMMIVMMMMVVVVVVVVVMPMALYPSNDQPKSGKKGNVATNHIISRDYSGCNSSAHPVQLLDWFDFDGKKTKCVRLATELRPWMTPLVRIETPPATFLFNRGRPQNLEFRVFFRTFSTAYTA